VHCKRQGEETAHTERIAQLAAYQHGYGETPKGRAGHPANLGLSQDERLPEGLQGIGANGKGHGRGDERHTARKKQAVAFGLGDYTHHISPGSFTSIALMTAKRREWFCFPAARMVLFA
jgi:hypothetical protein